MFDEGREITFAIENVHDGRAWLSDGVIAFRPTGSGRPELAKVAQVDGRRVEITPPKANPFAKGAYETRIVG